jgi:hypothetical protein
MVTTATRSGRNSKSNLPATRPERLHGRVHQSNWRVRVLFMCATKSFCLSVSPCDCVRLRAPAICVQQLKPDSSGAPRRMCGDGVYPDVREGD